MTTRHMIPGSQYNANDVELFKLIDQHGGWLQGYQFVGFCHTEERQAGFCNSPANDDWWTVVANADDYYFWKLSPEAVQRIVDAVHQASQVTKPALQAISFRDSHNWPATVSWEVEAR